MNPELIREALIKHIRSGGLEEAIINQYGVNSLNEITPDQFTNCICKHYGIALSSVELYVLAPFTETKIDYITPRGSSFYKPSCLFMDYLIHLMNQALVDNDNFIRYCPNYHPYYLRLYYGILFWIQCLRARNDAHCLGSADSSFLNFFTTTFPPESLPICGPLMHIFQSLCTSQPEIKSFGLVIPDLPKKPGPSYRHEFMKEDINSFFLPNIPGIFALIRDLYDTIHDDSKGRVYPDLACHTPVPPGATKPIQFGFHNFPILAQRSDFERYALCSPGLQYPCEAYKETNRSFYKNYNYIPFPALHADDKLAEFPAFLHLDGSPQWFESIVLIAAKAAKFFEESGFLSDCSPKGLPINQYVCNIQRPDTLPVAPRYSADPKSLIQFSLKLSLTVRKPITRIEAMAASCQTHIKMYHQHPYLGAFGEPVGTGPFWDIRPIETSSIDVNSYLSYHQIIKEKMKDDIKRSRTC